MVATTTTWAIPYAQSTDPFCDGAEITQALAERVDELLDAQDVGLQSLERPPYASVSITHGQLTQLSTYYMYFDTTDEDTNNLVDIALDPLGITPRPTGIWLAGINANSATANPGSNFFTIGTTSAITQVNMSQSVRENDGARAQSSLKGELIGDDSYLYTLYTHLYVNTPTPTQVLVNQARRWVWRFSDL